MIWDKPSWIGDESEVQEAIRAANFTTVTVRLTAEQTVAYLGWLKTGEGPCPVEESIIVALRKAGMP